MRVISGLLKGRIIKGDKINGTRPTMDKIKQSLFAMIQNNVRDAVCLDLFAGSGSLGIEALSNGASFVYFVDKSKEAYDTVIENIKIFNIKDQTQTFMFDYMKALTYFKNNDIKFNLIFLDPPYKEKYLGEILDFIDKNNLLHHNGQVICELSGYELNTEYGHLKLAKQRDYGDKSVNIFVNHD